MMELDVVFIGTISDRTEMRKGLLDDFEKCLCNEESYKNFLDNLFDLEESLTHIYDTKNQQ